MGPQPPLPLPHKDRRPKPHPLPVPVLTPPSFAPPLLLSHRNFPLDPARALTPPLLGPHKWLTQRHCRLGDSAKPVPLGPCDRLRRAFTFRLAKWQEQNARDLEAHQHRRHCGSTGWKVWRHPACGCVDELCEGPGRSLHQLVHVLLVLAQLDRPAESELRGRFLGTIHNQRTLAHTDAAVFNGVLPRAKSEQANWANQSCDGLGRRTSCQCAEILNCVPSHRSERATTNARAIQVRRLGSHAVPHVDGRRGRQFWIFILLGRSARLGPLALLHTAGTQQSRAPMGPASTPLDPRQGVLLWRCYYGCIVTVYLELEAQPALGSLQ